MRAVHQSPDDQLLDQLTAQALVDADYWLERLEALQGQHTVEDARRRLASMGLARVLEQLDAIGYPAASVDDLDPDQRWTKSEAEVRMENRYEPGNRGRATVCIRSLESLQRAKATALFWELAGAHPLDVANDPNGQSLEIAWGYFIDWKAYATLATRAAMHKDGNRFGALAKACRIMTGEFLVFAPSKEEIQRAGELAAQVLASMSAEHG